jgi:hypothetical protein
MSLPVLNPYTILNRDFDDYRLMEDHNDFAGMVGEIAFPGNQPRCYFLNLGETHYPYRLTGDDLPHISGVHGVLKHLDESLAAPDQADFFAHEEMQRLHRQQMKCVEYDHGELFGEEGYFGHGPIMHEKCFEVPFVEGLRP